MLWIFPMYVFPTIMVNIRCDATIIARAALFLGRSDEANTRLLNTLKMMLENSYVWELVVDLWEMCKQTEVVMKVTPRTNQTVLEKITKINFQ